jgi:hypothetical protein
MHTLLKHSPDSLMLLEIYRHHCVAKTNIQAQIVLNSYTAHRLARENVLISNSTAQKRREDALVPYARG